MEGDIYFSGFFFIWGKYNLMQFQDLIKICNYPKILILFGMWIHSIIDFQNAACVINPNLILLKN